jgi:hypothetical protein
MGWKRYAHVALMGAASGIGVVIAARIGQHGLTAAHVIVGCIATAIVTAKVTEVAISKSR